jgi:serine/threonine protein kinase
MIEPGGTEKLMCGSPGYVAPDIYTKMGYNCKADIFSLGIILYTVHYIQSIKKGCIGLE